MRGVDKVARIVNQKAGYKGGHLTLAYAEVTDTDPFTIDINGAVEEPDYDASYTPNTGDIVYCLVQGNTILVVNQVLGAD